MAVDPDFVTDDASEGAAEVAAQTVVRNPVAPPRGKPPAAAAPASDILGCTAPENQVIIDAFVRADSAIAVAIGKTPTNDPARWATWFTANPNKLTQDHVVSTLTDIKTRTLGSQIRCLRQETAGTAQFERCNQIHVWAYVNIPQPVIWLCPRFFEQTPAWQSNTLIHEAAHLALEEPDFKPAADKTPNNSVAQAMALAREDLYFALRNASNIAHFVTNDPSM